MNDNGIYHTQKTSEINFSEDILIPIKTGKVIDKLFSFSEGIMPATIILVPGESGVGKTTLILQLFGMVKEADLTRKVLFVSSEMNSIHIFKYKRRVNFENLEVCMLSESKTPYQELLSILQEGWDIVFLDSFEDTVNKLKRQLKKPKEYIENELLDLMDSIRRGNNDCKKFTTFFCTQHMTKAGVYKGSTNLKHMTDGMLELHCDGDESYAEFTKNRDGRKGERLYYSINNDGITFDVERFNNRDNVKLSIVQDNNEESLIEQEFDKMFSIEKPFKKIGR
jgi:predicted ATP-dependent serine protease